MPRAVLTDLVGRKAALSLLQLDDFPRRFVATVDNLGGARAPARLWPVVPAAGVSASSGATASRRSPPAMRSAMRHS